MPPSAAAQGMGLAGARVRAGQEARVSAADVHPAGGRTF
ncbi:hypothetical protein PMI15_00591 [Polaromonas sp. CF318]|nr:hypothetical protein PMI15_00591 [Polaromonas sp. CF318]